MSIAGKVLSKVSALTDEQQQRVLEFIDSLEVPSLEPKRSLYGLFKGFDTTEEEIAESRSEMWDSFPREDL